MNKKILGALLALACGFSLPGVAEESSGIYLGLGQNYFSFDDNRILDDENDFYVVGGYQINNHWGVELEYTELDSNLSTPGNASFPVDFLSLNARYRYHPRNMSSFFWKMGAGEYDKLPNNSKTSMARLGAGYDWALTERFSLVAGVDAMASFSKSNLDWVSYIGVNYLFASQAPKAAPVVAPKPQPQDGDHDGIIDSMDQCPATKPGVKVDANGCELDSDNDGVVDSIDQCPNTPSGAKVDDKGCRVMLTENVSITLNVQFANNSNVVTDAYRDEIGKVADFMKQYPDTTVVIEGHTDSRGAANYNQQLSQQRANAVMQYLIDSFRIDAARLSAVGKGEAYPIASNDTAEGRAANRRVQAEIKASVVKPL